jgi:hypothetical protein
MDHYAEVNKAYLEFFTSDPKPVSQVFRLKCRLGTDNDG